MNTWDMLAFTLVYGFSFFQVFHLSCSCPSSQNVVIIPNTEKKMEGLLFNAVVLFVILTIHNTFVTLRSAFFSFSFFTQTQSAHSIKDATIFQCYG